VGDEQEVEITEEVEPEEATLQPIKGHFFKWWAQRRSGSPSTVKEPMAHKGDDIEVRPKVKEEMQQESGEGPALALKILLDIREEEIGELEPAKEKWEQHLGKINKVATRYKGPQQED
jgi:hypothetical protein